MPDYWGSPWDRYKKVGIEPEIGYEAEEIKQFNLTDQMKWSAAIWTDSHRKSRQEVCEHCGLQLAHSDDFCQGCGAQREFIPSIKKPRDVT